MFLDFKNIIYLNNYIKSNSLKIFFEKNQKMNNKFKIIFNKNKHKHKNKNITTNVILENICFNDFRLNSNILDENYIFLCDEKKFHSLIFNKIHDAKNSNFLNSRCLLNTNKDTNKQLLTINNKKNISNFCFKNNFLSKENKKSKLIISKSNNFIHFPILKNTYFNHIKHSDLLNHVNDDKNNVFVDIKKPYFLFFQKINKNNITTKNKEFIFLNLDQKKIFSLINNKEINNKEIKNFNSKVNNVIYLKYEKEWKEFFINRVFNFISDQKNKFKFLVCPHYLGEICVEFSIKNKKMMLTFFSSNKQVCKILKSALPELENRFIKNQIKFDEIVILENKHLSTVKNLYFYGYKPDLEILSPYKNQFKFYKKNKLESYDLLQKFNNSYVKNKNELWI